MMDTAISRKSAPVEIPGYRLNQLVGKGGMGEVHQATQLSLDRVVAVKLLKPELAQDPQFVGRFEKEGAALATLRHPHVVSIVDRGKAGDTYFLVMEFVDGPSLREKLRDPDFNATQALLTMLLVARAIEYAHGRGVIHRDLKPENILFDEQAGDIPKVTDFGLAGLDESFGPQQRHLTQTHVSMGTATYMAPEQAVDAKSAGPRADLYSLGVMLYEAVTGELPIGSFSPPSVKKPGVDKRLDAIVAKCLRTSPEDRYASASALIADLERLVPVHTSGVSRSKETPSQRLLRRALEIGRRVGRSAAMLVVAFAAVIVAAALFRSRAEAKRVPAGVELMTDFGTHFPLSAVGRVDRATLEVSLGDGPDTVGLMAHGRKPELDGGSIDYGLSDDEQSGRMTIDVEVPGDGVVFSARVDTKDRDPRLWEPVLRVFRGTPPPARSALMVTAEDGRYVALVVAGNGDEPTLEWALGPDKRGLMRAPLPIRRDGQFLALKIDPTSGELTAVLGEGRDERMLGDGLRLGSEWRKLFGRHLRLAVGCLEGQCAFHQVSVQGVELPKPLPPPLVPADDIVVSEEPVTPKPAAVVRKKPAPIAAKPKPPVKVVVQKAPPPPAKVTTKPKRH